MNIEFITDSALGMSYPPIPIKKMLPEWYKNLSEYSVEKQYIHDAKYQVENMLQSVRSIKSCIPIRDYLTSGYIIRSHTQMLITPENLPTGEKTFWWKSSNEEGLEMHNHAQCPIKIKNTRHVYFKYPSSWKVKVPNGYSCLFYQPDFFFEEKFRFFPAIVDCDEYDSDLSFPGYITTTESFYINPGDPLMIVFPFKREEWTSSHRFVTEQEKNTPIKISHYLFRGYLKIFHKKKVYK